jgi:hypothetical protein
MKDYEIRWACLIYGGEEIHSVWFVKPEGKRSLRIPRRRWKDNIKINLKNKMGGRGLDESALVNMAATPPPHSV